MYNSVTYIHVGPTHTQSNNRTFAQAYTSREMKLCLPASGFITGVAGYS